VVLMYRSPQINVYVADVLRSVRFYERLGFAETFRTPREGVPVHVELVLDGFKIGVADVASARRDHGLDVSPDGRAVEVCLWCDDTDAAYDELVAAGATSMSAPHDWLDGRLRVAWVADPDGNPVELVQARDRDPAGSGSDPSYSRVN
jgi:catechol 2,3-dioxygenase-like lactoylglutathione lyase family enzyme